jgi:hypothetical protein
MFVTVGTGRDREDISKALALSIRHHQADRVWCLATLKSQEETLPFILRELGENAPPLQAVLVEDENDAEVCQRQFQRELADWIAAGVRPDDLIVDYTSGTKAMSAGLFAATVAVGVETISYIAGRRGASRQRETVFVRSTNTADEHASSSDEHSLESFTDTNTVRRGKCYRKSTV